MNGSFNSLEKKVYALSLLNKDFPLYIEKLPLNQSHEQCKTYCFDYIKIAGMLILILKKK